MNKYFMTIEWNIGEIVNELTPECIEASCHDFLCDCCCGGTGPTGPITPFAPTTYEATYDRKSGKIKLNRRKIKARIAKAMRAKRKA
jgi:hypothetical protein